MITKTRIGNHLRRHALGDQPTFRQGFKEGVAFAQKHAAPVQSQGESCGYDETTGNCTNNPCCRAAPVQQDVNQQLLEALKAIADYPELDALEMKREARAAIAQAEKEMK